MNDDAMNLIINAMPEARRSLFASVYQWWASEQPEKHKPFPANALTDTRTVTMGEPSKVARSNSPRHETADWRNWYLTDPAPWYPVDSF